MKRSAGIVIILASVVANFVINSWLISTSNFNATLYASFTLIEYILYSLFLYSQLQQPKAKRLLTICSIAFTLFFFIDLFFVDRAPHIDSIPIGVETIIILAFSFYYLYECMNNTTTLFIYNTSQFWIILGIVLYLAGSFFIYIFAASLKANEIGKYWFITNIFSILKNIFFCIAIYVHARPSKDSLKYDVELSSLN